MAGTIACRRAPRLPQPSGLIDLTDSRAPGDPKWAADAGAFVVSFPSELLAEARRSWPKELAANAAVGVLALVGTCPKERASLTYCVGDQRYRCPTCTSEYSRIGEYISGPFDRGLDQLRVQLSDDRDLLIDRNKRSRGPAASARIEPVAAPLGAPRCAAVTPPVISDNG